MKNTLTKQVLQLSINDVYKLLGQTKTGEEFGNLVIAGIKTKDGKVYDLLLDSNLGIVKRGEHEQSKEKLAKFFEKDFKPILFDNIPTWAHYATA